MTARELATVALSVLALVAVGCPSRDTSELVTAALEVIDTNVEVKEATAELFGPGLDGLELAVGDTVRTDDAGFGEVNYPDGSVTRLDAATVFTLVGLATGPQRVRTRLQVGRAWHRVKEVSGTEGSFDVETDAGIVGVRGTGFLTTCIDETCGFAVIEGAVTFEPPEGELVEVPPGKRAVVDRATGAVEAMEDLEPDDPELEFVERNVQLDEQRSQDEGGPFEAPTELAALPLAASPTPTPSPPPPPPTPTSTPTPTPTPGPTPSPMPTPSPSATATPTPSPSATPSPTPAPSPPPSASDPFTGRWHSIDLDGSEQTLNFSGDGDVRQVEYVDDDATAACESGGRFTAEGPGTISADGSRIDFTLEVVRCEDGTDRSDLQGIVVGFEHDPDTDTLSDGSVIWSRN